MNTTERATKSDWAAFAVLAVMALTPALVAGNSDFTFSDASRHAMDGVFVLDALAEMPVRNPVEWANRYYLTSPALGIGRYPPLFAVVQAPFYAALGVCPFAGRLAVAIMWLGGLVFFYETLRVQTGRWGGLFGAAVLAASPASIRWGADVMLELPATALLLAGSYFYLRYLSLGSSWRLAAATMLVCLAGWTKQPAALLVAAMVIHLLVLRRFVVREALPAFACAVLVLAPLGVLSAVFGRANLAIVSGAGRAYPLWSAGNWLYYIYQIPRWYLGWPLAACVLAGVVLAILGRARGEGRFYLLWAAVFYVFFSLVGLKSSRLAMFWTPGLAWFAATAFSAFAGAANRMLAVLSCAAAVAAVCFTSVNAVGKLPLRGDELAAVAQEVMSFAPKRVFYAGPQNGTFIFRLRQIGGRNRPVTIRDSKVLYYDFIARELGRTERPWTIDEIRAAIATAAPDVMVVEHSWQTEGTPPVAVKVLMDYTKTGDFERVGAVRRASGRAAGEYFEIFTYVGPRRPGPIGIPMPGVGMELELPGEGL